MDISTILMFVAIIAVFYFLMIRPQQKRTREQAEMQKALGPGDRVMTVHGIFGTIKHMGTKTAILELSPGAEMTVVLNAIARKATEAEEEFEYTDDEDVPEAEQVWEDEGGTVADPEAAVDDPESQWEQPESGAKPDDKTTKA